MCSCWRFCSVCSHYYTFRNCHTVYKQDVGGEGRGGKGRGGEGMRDKWVSEQFCKQHHMFSCWSSLCIDYFKYHIQCISKMGQREGWMGRGGEIHEQMSEWITINKQQHLFSCCCFPTRWDGGGMKIGEEGRFMSEEWGSNSILVWWIGPKLFLHHYPSTYYQQHHGIPVTAPPEEI